MNKHVTILFFAILALAIEVKAQQLSAADQAYIACSKPAWTAVFQTIFTPINALDDCVRGNSAATRAVNDFRTQANTFRGAMNAFAESVGKYLALNVFVSQVPVHSNKIRTSVANSPASVKSCVEVHLQRIAAIMQGPQQCRR